MDNSSKRWPGPVFANQKGVGWTKLNAARACAKCRHRHVKCRLEPSRSSLAFDMILYELFLKSIFGLRDVRFSLVSTGGPCTHCQKRGEVCEVLGWKFQPNDDCQLIYKYVLPPPLAPFSTPSNKNLCLPPIDPGELSQRLEHSSTGNLIPPWPRWELEAHNSIYQSQADFKEIFQKEYRTYYRKFEYNSSHCCASPETRSLPSDASPAATKQQTSYPPDSLKNCRGDLTAYQKRFCKRDSNQDLRSSQTKPAETHQENPNPHRMSLNFLLNSRNTDRLVETKSSKPSKIPASNL
ncbi:hypothetical protein O181_019733 [Austropuccinia psidii MF-1]|uniref:Zn(2)-C6 fungal-type domain-containing protein n=1 Tax=Austropuccinia psidii MF-1 TaxID=1389203 RepID=A0A9Q3CA63_9BASI|nr:hypothetical protein [Austropuccinia psidii MF-1]